jgi:hypothetical protein
MIVFPSICPSCGSEKGQRIIPESPEVQTFRCVVCRYEWSEPLRPFEIAPDPEVEAERARRWQLWPLKRKRPPHG